MTRPILWALGTLVSAAISSVAISDRLAARFGIGSPAPAVGSGQGTTESAIVAVSADLRGHFVVHPTLDGQRVRMLVDTGASVVALSYEDARLAGLTPARHAFTHRLATANGIVEAAPTRLREVRIGEITIRDVEAVILPEGRLATSLLGMSFLRRLAGFDISQGRLTLRGT